MIGLVMTDIKRVLAYSTISQLGYMMFALGSGGYVAAIFHLFTHAFFKALLFLGSGSVNHATNTFDMRLMGGLRKSMPITFGTFLIGSLSLSGVFPLAGFWSKDEILGSAWDNEPYLFWIGLVTAGLTALYMFRVIFMTFFGEYRGGAPEEDDETPALHDEHAASTSHGSTPHESPFNMAFPLLVLAVPAVLAGIFNLPWKFLGLDHEVEHLLVGALPEEGLVHESTFHYGLAVASTAVALGGIALAYVIYGAKLVPSSAAGAALPADPRAAGEQVLRRRPVRARHRGLPVLRSARRRLRGFRPHRRRWRRERRRPGDPKRRRCFALRPDRAVSDLRGHALAVSCLPPSSFSC